MSTRRFLVSFKCPSYIRFIRCRVSQELVTSTVCNSTYYVHYRLQLKYFSCFKVKKICFEAKILMKFSTTRCIYRIKLYELIRLVLWVNNLYQIILYDENIMCYKITSKYHKLVHLSNTQYPRQQNMYSMVHK